MLNELTSSDGLGVEHQAVHNLVESIFIDYFLLVQQRQGLGQHFHVSRLATAALAYHHHAMTHQLRLVHLKVSI